MRCALINPRWSFEGSIYFGCPAPHLPLELVCGTLVAVGPHGLEAAVTGSEGP